MADQEQYKGLYLRDSERNEEKNEFRTDYIEETSAEIAAPVTFDRGRTNLDTDVEGKVTEGRGMGIAALALSILSLFVLPILFGAAGIVLGFIARRRGAETLGTWAIGIGAVAIIIGIFIMPFF